MKFKDYLEKLEQHTQVTVIIVKAVKDEYTPFYHEEYKTTPILTKKEWLACDKKTLDLQVINNDHAPIDITGIWSNWYKRGQLKCCMLADENYLSTRYSEKQAKDMEDYYNREVK